MSTNGTTTHTTDEAIDVLYSYFPGATPPAPPCPEALFSLTLKGKLDGIETLLTVRGMTAEEFTRNLQQVRGLLDAPASPPASTEGQGWCAVHHVEMKRQEKGGRSWFSHWLENGTWCKGKPGR